MWFKKRKKRNNNVKPERFTYNGQLRIYNITETSELRELYYDIDEPICWFSPNKAYFSDTDFARKLTLDGNIYKITGYYLNKIFNLRGNERFDNQDVLYIVPFYQGVPGDLGTASFRKFIDNLVRLTGETKVISRDYEMR